MFVESKVRKITSVTRYFKLVLSNIHIPDLTYWSIVISIKIIIDLPLYRRKKTLLNQRSSYFRSLICLTWLFWVRIRPTLTLTHDSLEVCRWYLGTKERKQCVHRSRQDMHRTYTGNSITGLIFVHALLYSLKCVMCMHFWAVL